MGHRPTDHGYTPPQIPLSLTRKPESRTACLLGNPLEHPTSIVIGWSGIGVNGLLGSSGAGLGQAEGVGAGFDDVAAERESVHDGCAQPW